MQELNDGIKLVEENDLKHSHNIQEITGKGYTEMSFVGIYLSYRSLNELYGSIQVDPKWNECRLFVTQYFVDGTPVQNVSNIVPLCNNGKLEIYAFGNGFVVGHVAVVNVMLVR